LAANLVKIFMYLDREHNTHHIFQKNIKQISAALGLIKQFQILLKLNVSLITMSQWFLLLEFQQLEMFQDFKNNIAPSQAGIY